MYSWFPNLSHISLKDFFGKVGFFFLQILAEIEMTQNENRLFGRQFWDGTNNFFPWNMVVINVYIWFKDK